MAVDFKQLLMDNKALAAAYVVALSAIGGHFYFVAVAADDSRRPKRGSYGDLKRKIKTRTKNLQALVEKVDKKSLLTAADERAYDERNGKLDAKIKELRGLYASRDATLERWFDKPMDKDLSKGPEFGGYKVLYADKFAELTRNYERIVGQDSVLRAIVPEAKEMRAAQKKFWFIEALLTSLEKSGANRLLKNIEVTTPSPLNKEQRPPYELYGLSLQVEISFSKVPALIAEILKSELTFRIDEMSITRPNFDHNLVEPARIDVNGTAPKKYFAEPGYLATFPRGRTSFSGEESELIPEPAINVTLRVTGYDFDLATEANP